jgi:hypothetical protein
MLLVCQSGKWVFQLDLCSACAWIFHQAYVTVNKRMFQQDSVIIMCLISEMLEEIFFKLQIARVWDKVFDSNMIKFHEIWHNVLLDHVRTFQPFFLQCLLVANKKTHKSHGSY